MARFSLLFKILTLCGLMLVMLIPMTMIMGVISERAYYQQDVIHSVAQSSSYSQTVTGPIIVVPYTETTLQFNDKQKYYIKKQFLHYILPQQLNVDANAEITPRHISIYQAQVYQSKINFQGHFDKSSLEHLIENPDIDIEQPYLMVLISDTRGIMQVPSLRLNQLDIEFEPSTNQSGMGSTSGIHSDIALETLISDKLNFEFTLNLQGTKELAIVPVGRSTAYNLSGNWPHPNFIGNVLPNKREISENGFTAQWQSSWYANNINSKFVKDIDLTHNQSVCNYSDCLPSFKTNFVETVDQYQMTERAIKYDILIVALTFVCFFIFEMLKQLRIHPVQYLLIGMALTLFYLLLLALSEHIGFMLAYICGAIACSLLIGFYLSSVLKGFKWGMFFTLFLLSLYTVLYFVMISEGHALLLGSIMLFVILSGIMMLTRKIDWYKVTQVNVEKTGLCQRKPVLPVAKK